MVSQQNGHLINHSIPETNKFDFRVIQGVSKFVPILYCILRKAFNASLGKCTLIQVRNLSKQPFKAISN